MAKKKEIVLLPEIIRKDDQLWTTSLDISKKFGRDHKSIIRSIKNLECSKEFGRLNYAPSSYLNQQQKDQPMFLISRDGLSFLVPRLKGEIAAEWHEKYIKAFNQMEQTILQLIKQAERQADLKGQLEYQKARAEGKIIRRDTTDAIKRFVEHAESQGSTHAGTYYMGFTALANNIFFGIKFGTKVGKIKLPMISWIKINYFIPALLIPSS